MADEPQNDQKCYFASPEYSASFWGKYIWLYQGKGRLRLTTHSLCLEGCPQAVEIPFHDIQSLGLGRFSLWSKPAGLSHLIVRYSRNGEPSSLNLVPYESALAPTWRTSKLVSGWYQKLGQVEELAGRIEPSDFDPAPPYTTAQRLAAAAALILVPLAAFLTAMALSTARF